MKWRTEKIPVATLMVLTALAILALALAERSTMLVRQPYYEEKIRAAKTMLLAMNAIKTAGQAKGLTIDSVNDPNATGMIGSEFTLVTTDRGDLTAKLLTTHPDFAASAVEMLIKARLKKGDPVAVGMTGSFPALNIAVLSALESLELKPFVIVSVGSSSWGANDPRMTWLDMDRILREKGILRTRTLAASIGGGKDIGRGLSPEGRKLILEAIKRNRVKLISKPLLEENIQARMAIYDEAARGKKIKAYINIGGGVASLGSSINGDLIPSGLNRNLAFRNFPTKGVIHLMADRGMPVIHLLNVSEIAKRYGLSMEAALPKELGQGPIYFKERYDRVRLALIFLMLAGATVAAVRVNLFHYLAQLRQIRSRGMSPGTSVLPPLEPPTDKNESKNPTRSKP